jgi:NAD(P)-dependent dehydrogenase (short-subunit alcohol dehydrogenase family)
MEKKKRVVLVTGGGRGIGRSISLEFARAGYRVVIASDVRSEVEAVRAECVEEGADSLGLVVDVRREDDVSQMVKDAVANFGSLDIMVTSAGIIDLTPVVETESSSWEDVITVNLTGTFLCVRDGVREMVKRGWGRIICVASLAGKTGGKFGAAYSASKHGVLGLVRSLALEVADQGVTVNAICPGFVQTGMAEKIRPIEARLHGLKEKELMDGRLRQIPIGRYLLPGEIAPVALFLASDQASGITGQALSVDGGVLPV